MQDDENVRELIMEDMKRRRVHEEGQTSLARQRLEFDKEHAAINQNRFLQNQEVTDRRIRLDEHRFDLEKEDRKETMNEKRQMLELMEMITQRLSKDQDP
eukprot:IDg10894t1